MKRFFTVTGLVVLAGLLIAGTILLVMSFREPNLDQVKYNQFKEICANKGPGPQGKSPYVVENLCIRGNNVLLRYGPP